MKKHIYILMLMLLCASYRMEAQDIDASIVKYEYWFDDNYAGRVVVDTISELNSQVYLNLFADISGISDGAHRIYCRAKNSLGKWSTATNNIFYKYLGDGERVLKDVRKCRYAFSDGTVKEIDVTAGQSLTQLLSIDLPSADRFYIDKKNATFDFNGTTATMTRSEQCSFALQFENDQNGWCPPLHKSYTMSQTLDKTVGTLRLGGSLNVNKPHKGDFEAFIFTLSSPQECALKSSERLTVLLFKSITDELGSKWMNFVEISPDEMVATYRENLEAGTYYGIIYTPEQFEDGVASKPDIYLLGVCSEPEIVVNEQIVTIGGLEPDALYYYTLDGSEPTIQSIQYTGPFEVAKSCVVKAIAVKDGLASSSVVAKTITIGGPVIEGAVTELPVATFSEGILSLTCDTENAIIYYGINEEPNHLYTEPIQLTDNRPVKFYAQSPGYAPSQIDTYTPNYFKCSIRAWSDRYIRVKSDDIDARIYWTSDGSIPTEESNFTYGSNAFYWYFTLTAYATAPYKINSDTITFTPDAFYNGYINPTNVNVPGKLSQAYEWMKTQDEESQLENSAKMIRVIGTINAEDIAFIQQMPDLEYIDLSEAEVVEQTLPDNAFAGMNIRYFCSPKNLTSVGNGILAGCKRLGGIEWNSNIDVPVDILGGVNYPNLLLYVKSASLANGNVFHNVISSGAAQRVELTDANENGCFYAIRSFNAQKISYTRDFKMQTLVNGESQGWETIALPFDVETVTHEINGECAPFQAISSEDDKRRQFWICDIDTTRFISTASLPRKYHQYIVSMPNNEVYSDEFILSGKVTFSARNQIIPATNSWVSNGINDYWANGWRTGQIDRYDYTDLGDVRLYSNYEYLEPSDERSTINLYEAYDGHNPGSVFVPGVYGCKPFEAYIEYVQQPNQAPRRGPVIGIGDGTTGIKSTPMKYADNDVYSRDGKLYIYSKVEKDMPLYNVMGQLVKNVHLQVGENVIDALPAGTYLVKGKKFMINYKR